MTTRAKFKCHAIEQTEGSTYSPEKGKYTNHVMETAKFYPVSGGTTEENAKFFASTPSGEIKLTCVHQGLFRLGGEYYVDFTPAPKG
jgi:hypothetical protein